MTLLQHKTGDLPENVWEMLLVPRLRGKSLPACCSAAVPPSRARKYEPSLPSMMIDRTRRTFVAGAGAAAAGAAAGAVQAQPASPRALPPADIILKNGKIITVDGASRIVH